MTKILFVCHGNICRSVAAEMALRQLVHEAHKERSFTIDSAAVSAEELGNDIYPPMKRALQRAGIAFSRHSARQITRRDYDRYDRIIGMDHDNLRRMRRIFGEDPEEKLSLLLDWCGKQGREIDDPWYTRDFDGALKQIMDGCQGLWQTLSAR